MDSLKLKGRLVAAGLTYTDVAKAMNLSKNTICRKINGQTAFTTDEVIKLCDLLLILDNGEKCDIFLRHVSQ